MDRNKIVARLKELEILLRQKISDERRYDAERLVIELNRRLLKMDYAAGTYDKTKSKI